VYGDFYAQAGCDVYAYRFSFVSENEQRKDLGAKHGAEMPFVFGNLKGYGIDHADAVQRKLADSMHTAWVNFIKYGDPNGAAGGAAADSADAAGDNPDADVARGAVPAWPKYDTEEYMTMHFGDTISSERMFNLKEIRYFERWL
jgi:carboxylesterase type B